MVALEAEVDGRLAGEAVGCGGEHAGGGVGGAGGERVAFDEDHAEPALGKLIGDGGADNAPADHDRVG